MTKDGKRKMTRQLKDISGMRVFLSGPITGMPHKNAAAFAVAALRLKEEARVAYVYDPVREYVLSPLAHMDAMAKSHAECMANTLHNLSSRRLERTQGQGSKAMWPLKYHVVVMLPGWQKSQGAREEHRAALAMGIEVCELKDVLADE